MMQRWTPPNRYMLRRNTARIIKDLDLNVENLRMKELQLDELS